MESANQIEQQQNNERIPEEQPMAEDIQQEVQEHVKEQQPPVLEEAQEVSNHEDEKADIREEESMAVDESSAAPQGESSADPQGESSAAPQGESSAAPQVETSAAPQGEEVIEEKSIFVGGISSSVLQENLVEYFTQFGEVKEVSVKENTKGGKSTRFAFVNFADPANNDKVLAVAEHTVKDTKIDVKLSIPKISTRKVFVRNIGSLTDEEIRNHFSKFGQAGRIERPSGKAYCFISFQTAQAAVEALKEAKQTIGSTEVTVSKAHPPLRKTQSRGRGGMSSRGYNQRYAPRYAPYGSRPVSSAFYEPAPYYDASYGSYNPYPYSSYAPSPSNFGKFRGGRRGAGGRPY